MSLHSFTVYGVPVTQGSKVRGRYSMYDANAKKLKPWRRAVTNTAEKEWDGKPPLEGALDVWVTVTVPRPKYHFRSGRNAHLLRDAAPTYPAGGGTGDSDKYARAVLDSLTDAKVWLDDSQVTDLAVVKRYPGTNGIGVLERPGVYIIVNELRG